MYSKLKLSELKNTNFKTKHHFLYKIVKVLEVANFTFLANFRFLTLPYYNLSHFSMFSMLLIFLCPGLPAFHTGITFSQMTEIFLKKNPEIHIG